MEFQPSAWSRGSYLNVGAMWLWHEHEHHIRFDVGHRVDTAGFAEYENDEQFAPLAKELASSAAQRIRVLRRQFADLDAAVEYLVANNPGTDWPAFNAGVALGVSERVDEAQRVFRSLEANPGDPRWWVDAVTRGHELAALLDAPDGVASFRQVIAKSVRAFRADLKLDPDVELRW